MLLKKKEDINWDMVHIRTDFFQNSLMRIKRQSCVKIGCI